MRSGRGFAVAATAAVALAGAASAGSATPAATPTVQSLITRATAMVRARQGFSKAVLLEADGTAKGAVTTAAGITSWRFVYNNQTTPKFKYRSAFVGTVASGSSRGSGRRFSRTGT